MLDFFLAMEHNAQLDIDLASLRESCAAVRAAARNPTLRANIAAFEGLLSTYGPMEAGALQVVPTARPDLIRLFDEMVEDVAYSQFASNAARYGVREKWRRAMLAQGATRGGQP